MRRIPTDPQAGFTLPELVVTLGLGMLIAATSIAYSVPWIAREAARSAVNDLQSTIQLGRMEAINRNRPCRLVLDVDNRTVQIWDGMGTSNQDDDRKLHDASLPGSVSFSRPDPGSAVTLGASDGPVYEAVLDADGSVATGQGEIVLYGGGLYFRMTLFAAGGIRTERWHATSWGAG